LIRKQLSYSSINLQRILVELLLTSHFIKSFIPEKSIMSNKPCTVLIGNPGSGKSTLLNTVMGARKFQSGVSFGSGLTQALQIVPSPAMDFADTPGLSDPTIRERAAEEINSLFVSRSNVCIVFVVTIESGRVRPDDVATITSVLNSLNIADLTDRFSIIVNKVKARTAAELERNAEARDKVVMSLTFKHKTRHVHILSEDPSADE
jgi:GTPase Era involved in 16S rRNA processing